MATISISQLDSAVSLALGDLFEIAEPDAQSQTGYASKKISLSQEAAFIQENVESQNLNTTSKTLVGAINEVDSECVKWSENNVLGAKNLLKYPYENSYKVHRAVTFSDYDGKGAIKANGTNDNTGVSWMRIEYGLKLEEGIYLFTGGISSDYYFGIRSMNSSGTETILGEDKGSGFIITVSSSDAENLSYNFYVYVDRNKSADNVIYYPMLRLASITDNKWMPYAESNRNLTIGKLDASEIATVENTDNASQAYTIGDYMIWKGGFYKVTSAISSGGAITVGTNITKTTIGAELKAALNA